MQTHFGFRKAVGLLVALTGCVVLAVPLGCNDNNSPTAVAPPPPPVPEPTIQQVITGARVTFMVNNPGGQSGEILFDGRPIWAGTLESNYSSGWYYYYDGLFQQVLTLEHAALTPGAHTLAFRAPGRKAVNYSLSGWVDLSWSPSFSMRVANWQDESAWVKTGSDWTREVVFSATPPG
jgi:hypothetical protein